MREIIHLQVGQCGNKISEKFLASIAHEHALDLAGISYQHPTWDRVIHREVYFKEQASGRYCSRSLVVDLDRESVDSVASGPVGSLIRPDNIIAGLYGTGNRFAKGHYTEGAEIIDQILDVVRREAEESDSLQGFQIAHSIGGGTGSGLGTLMMSKIREEFPDRMMLTFTVAPSPKVSDTVVEPYNAVLATHQLVENADAVIVLDNEALYDMCTKTLNIRKPSYGDVNSIVGLAMSHATASWRFPGQLNSDLRKTGINLIPFPRLHFFVPSLSPMYPTETQRSPGIPDLLLDLFQTPNQLVSCNPYAGRFLAGAATLRGQLCQNEVEKMLKNYRDRYSREFAEWIPESLKSSCCPVTPPDCSLTSFLLSNNTCINKMFDRISRQFHAMFRRKAFLYGLCGEGMDEMEFTEAASNLTDLMEEYKQYQECSLYEEDESQDGL